MSHSNQIQKGKLFYFLFLFFLFFSFFFPPHPPHLCNHWAVLLETRFPSQVCSSRTTFQQSVSLPSQLLGENELCSPVSNGVEVVTSDCPIPLFSLPRLILINLVELEEPRARLASRSNNSLRSRDLFLMGESFVTDRNCKQFNPS